MYGKRRHTVLMVNNLILAWKLKILLRTKIEKNAFFDRPWAKIKNYTLFGRALVKIKTKNRKTPFLLSFV